MKRLRLFIAAAVLGLVTTACSSDLVGPDPSAPSYNSNAIQGPAGQGGFGSGG